MILILFESQYATFYILLINSNCYLEALSRTV